MKVLMSAYACEPGRGSEPGVGWNWAVQAARTHEVWVLTVSTGRQAIEKALEETPNPNLHFIYHDGPRPISHLLGRSGAFRYVHYYTWQASALSVARKLHARVGFDVAHHVTYAGFRFPSFLFALGVPYVWGPVGGSATPPLRFITTFGVHGAITQVARMCSNIFAKFDPLLWITARRARLVVADSPETIAALPIGSTRNAVLESQSALRDGEVPPRRATQHDSLRAAYLGALYHWKGLHLGIKAVAEARRQGRNVILTLIATGPEEQRLSSLAERLGVADAVIFAGPMSRQAALEMLAEQDCLLFPSFQDSGGPFAVLEAMAAGLPVICLNIGGPSVSITPETGFRIEPGSHDQVVHDLSEALMRFADDPELCCSMGKAANKRFREEFVWDRKASVINSLYAEALQEPAEVTKTALN